MKLTVKLPLVVFVMALNGACVSAQPDGSRSVLAGVYTEAQATRGQALYYQHCLECHGEMMNGQDQAPPLAGPQFSSNWEDVPLMALIARIMTMPPEKPGSLTMQENVDVLTYMLWFNGLPLGDTPLSDGQEVLAELTYQTPLPGQ